MSRLTMHRKLTHGLDPSLGEQTVVASSGRLRALSVLLLMGGGYAAGSAVQAPDGHVATDRDRGDCCKFDDESEFSCAQSEDSDCAGAFARCQGQQRSDCDAACMQTCATALSTCLSKPLCDVECLPDRGLNGGRYFGLCEDAQPAHDRKTIDTMFMAMTWRVFTALNHPANFGVGQREPVWLRWYEPRPDACAASSRTASVVADGARCLLPDAKELDRYRDPTWQPGATLTNTRPPDDNPLHYTLEPDNERLQVRSHKHVGPQAQDQERVCERMNLEKQLAAVSVGELANQRWGRRFDTLGPINLKSSWVEFAASDDRHSDYLCRADLNERGRRECLIALHLTIKTSHTQNFWTWATFEHEGLESLLESGPVACADPHGPSYVAQARPQYAGADEYLDTVHAFNDQYRRQLQDAGLDKLAHYRVVGVQRPIPLAMPKGFGVWPPLLSNRVIEWDRPQSSCVGCHSRALHWVARPGEAAYRDWTDSCDTAAGGCDAPRGVPSSDMFWGYVL